MSELCILMHLLLAPFSYLSNSFMLHKLYPFVTAEYPLISTLSFASATDATVSVIENERHKYWFVTNSNFEGFCHLDKLLIF